LTKWSRTEPVPIESANREHTAYVLDEQLQPVPAGIAGELYIGGDGLAARPINGRTECCKFIPNPFGKLGRALLHR